jgi:hypothetical protein
LTRYDSLLYNRLTKLQEIPHDNKICPARKLHAEDEGKELRAYHGLDSHQQGCGFQTECAKELHGMTRDLTEQQAEVFKFVRQYKRFHGDTPTVKAITHAFGWTPRESAEHISSLCAKNFLIRELNNLRVVDPDYCEHCGGRS